MVSIDVVMVLAVAYLAGASPIALMIKQLLQQFCPICGTRSDEFVRTIANIIKGFVIVALASIAGPTEAQIATLFVFLGHIYPVQHRFKGGNGMAVLLGSMVALHPVLGLIALFSWLFGYFVFRYTSIAASMSAIVTMLCCHYLALYISIHLMLLLTVIVVWRHREGLARVANGTEEMVVWD